MTIQTELRALIETSRLLYESDEFMCGYFEAAIVEMFKLLPESDQAVFLNVVTKQKEKIVEQAKYRGLM